MKIRFAGLPELAAFMLQFGCTPTPPSAPGDRASSGPDDRTLTDPHSVVSGMQPAARPAPIDDLYFTRSVGGNAWSPDGRQIVFSSDISGRFNLWRVNASEGWPIQLTQSDDGQWNAAWSPDGKWIVYQEDHAGNELYDLYAIPADGGEPMNLTHTPAIREQDPRWSADGSTIAFAYKPKEGTAYDVALLDWTSRSVRKLTNEQQAGYSWAGYRYSRFCELFKRWRRKQDVVLRQEHKAGEKLFVDWAGTTIPIHDPRGGPVQQAHLFVAVLRRSDP